MNINDVLIRVLKKNDELSEQMLYRNEEEDEVKHTLKIKARDREMAGIPHKLANFLPPPPSPTQMVSSSPSINHGPPFDIPGYAHSVTGSFWYIHFPTIDVYPRMTDLP